MWTAKHLAQASCTELTLQSENMWWARYRFVAEENILTPDSLLHMLELHNKVLAIKADNKTWTDLCYRIPIADIFLTKRRKKRQIAIGEKLD